MGREENFALINFIRSSSHPPSLLFSTDLSLGTTLFSFFFFFSDHTENKMKLRVSTEK